MATFDLKITRLVAYVMGSLCTKVELSAKSSCFTGMHETYDNKQDGGEFETKQNQC